NGGGTPAWAPVDSGYRDDLYSLTLGANSRTALIGGADGLVLTLTGGRFESARAGDLFAPLNAGAPNAAHGAHVVGVAVLPGYAPGQVEAWAALRSVGRVGDPGAILHYASDSAEPLLDAGAGRAAALPDTAEMPGAVTFAAFGNSACQFDTRGMPCPELVGSN